MMKWGIIGVIATTALVGCGDQSGLQELESDPVSASVDELVQKSLEADGWSEDDRVFCDEVSETGERVPGGAYSYREISLIEGADGDIYVVRFCNTVSRDFDSSGARVFDELDTCGVPRVEIVGEQGLLEFACWRLEETGDENGGYLSTLRQDLYLKKIGNVNDIHRTDSPTL
ncbi:MAG: hypothetical protein AAGF92_17695 [Myxococcota bacterium]